MIRGLMSLYRLGYFGALVYMLQNTEYRLGPFYSWYYRVADFGKVMTRRTLELTKAARLLKLAIVSVAVVVILSAALLITLGLKGSSTHFILIGVLLLAAYPLLCAHLIAIPLFFGWLLIKKPKERRDLKRAREIFRSHPGIKIAVAGSYGKTSMKEILLTVLSTVKNVAATPANRNVLSSHAQFAGSLKGNEDLLIIEYGEGKPGDITKFAELCKPDYGFITGIAPAHLDRYKTLEAAARDIFSLKKYVENDHLYVNDESSQAKPFVEPGMLVYNREGIEGWVVENIEIKPESTNFDMKKSGKSLKLSSGLIGRHQVGPLAAAASLAARLGLSDDQIIKGIAAATPFEHRMKPKYLHGAWIIDDTYNGNIEGIKAGLQLLKELKAGRRIYVTPGLVDQGVETEKVHIEVGKYIAEVAPDIVVLMQNSVSGYIQKGMGDFKGEVIIEDNPLNFYNNLPSFIAAGDVVLMQNDWTDNYA